MWRWLRRTLKKNCWARALTLRHVVILRITSGSADFRGTLSPKRTKADMLRTDVRTRRLPCGSHLTVSTAVLMDNAIRRIADGTLPWVRDVTVSLSAKTWLAQTNYAMSSTHFFPAARHSRSTISFLVLHTLQLQAARSKYHSVTSRELCVRLW
ncbi:hypothetical protein BDY17DRAFT_141245 [Neohortaea acidophila]|uniref:Uncharacterized protein n=1 Tax=Neohortaea acidophila TaxID=245834 RepID=A0A6A6PTS5_9PEZI|nr:uncharacterized protein BDY17DRAFT_141245 [Neohortaea acidophila]KAF2483091.1 hypothetical protein BDY17DRAFT_141245 [Neohortaea acidophila]